MSMQLATPHALYEQHRHWHIFRTVPGSPDGADGANSVVVILIDKDLL
jgi:hypothetical protein